MPTDLATYPTQYVVATLDPTVDLPNDLYSFFVQDQWRLRTNLTLNLGASLRSRNRLQQDHRRARRQQQLPAAARRRVGSVQRRQDRGARRLRPLRRSELPEHPAQRRVREGRRRDGDRQSRAIPIRTRAAPRTATPPSITVITPKPHTPETRTASVGVKREIVPGFARVGRRRVCARLQPVRLAGSQLPGSGDRPASRPDDGPHHRIRRLRQLVVLGAAGRRRRPAERQAELERVVHLVEERTRRRGLPVHRRRT